MPSERIGRPGNPGSGQLLNRFKHGPNPSSSSAMNPSLTSSRHPSIQASSSSSQGVASSSTSTPPGANTSASNDNSGSSLSNSVTSGNGTKKLGPPPTNKVVSAKYDALQPLQAASLSSTQHLAAVGCSSHVKIVHLYSSGVGGKLQDLCMLPLKSSSFDSSYTARAGNFTVTDVEWGRHVSDGGKIAASTTNGSVSIFNVEYGVEASTGKLNRQSKRQQDWQNEEITRSVHKLSWHNTRPGMLAAAAQDGLVRIFDSRDKLKPCAFTFSTGRSDAVRDLQFSPTRDYLLASMHDNGSLCIWDMRNMDGGGMWARVSAHTTLGLAVAWHPSTDMVIATGSRDKTCKVWNLTQCINEQTVAKPTHTLHTPNAVARIAWRPENGGGVFTNQLAIASAVDNEVSVWDIRNPYIPACLLRGHTDAVMDIEWLDTPNPNYIPSADTDNKQRQESKKHTNAHTHISSNNKRTDDLTRFDKLGVHQHIFSASKDHHMMIQDLRCGYFHHQHMSGRIYIS